MKQLHGPTVITGWATALAALMFIALGFGPRDGDIPIFIFASSVGLLEIIGAVAWFILRRHERWAAETPALTRSTDAMMVGLAAVFIGMGIVYKPWMIIGAAWPVLVLILHAVDHFMPADKPHPPFAEDTA